MDRWGCWLLHVTLIIYNITISATYKSYIYLFALILLLKFDFVNLIKNIKTHIQKKLILGLRIEYKLRNAGVPTERLFSHNAWFKKKQMFGWHPCDSELGSNPQAQNWFFEYGLDCWKKLQPIGFVKRYNPASV